MVNTELLKEKINERGLKLYRIAEIIGITRQSLSHKIENKTQFKQKEIQVLCDLLNLSQEDMNNIFLNKSIANTIL